MRKANPEDFIRFCEESFSEVTVISPEPRRLTMIDALDTIHTLALESKLAPDFWQACKEEISYLRKRTGLTPNQLVLLSCLCENGSGMSWRGIGRELGLSRLKAMSLSPDMEDLRQKRWVTPYAVREFGDCYQGYKQVPGIITAFREDREFKPEILDGLTLQAFVQRVRQYISQERNNHNLPEEAKRWWMMYILKSNLHLRLCKVIDSLKCEMSKVVMLAAVADYSLYAGEHNEGLLPEDMTCWLDDMTDEVVFMSDFQDGSHELIERGLLENACIDGMADQELFRITREVREDLLAGFVPVKAPRQNRGRRATRDLLRCSRITPKELHYDPGVREQIDRLCQLLSADGLPRIQERLESLGHRKGCAILLYGSPGTGKTETVLQLARQTGRDVMQVNIAGIRDKFVGETEKNIKGIFSRYRDLCHSAKTMPILLFNEADALINSRLETTRSSAEKMDNAMQNIILQEMENLDGILLATTNLTGALDKAFDRRFLFKVEFTKPSAAVRASIWADKLPHLSSKECVELAEKFDFSGGQIENVARKAEIEFVLSGSQADLGKLTDYCNQECINRSSRNRIGF